MDAAACRRWPRTTTETVATVVYSKRALDHIERAFAYPSEKAPDAAQNDVTAIQSAVDNLAAHPLIGRRSEGDLRELIISYGRSGYVALYRFVISADEVRILAIRHQREVGFQP